jgi:cytochrome c oxidase assembly protein subunit 15
MNQKRQFSLEGLFRNLGITTIIAVYLLILVGGIVRSTGSGMGCPDWPKCFGKWIPPTEVSQLPENYKEVYANQRKEKNVRLAKYLKGFGWEDLAKKITEDQSIYQEADFNFYKTWTEYINRLIGVLIGFLIFLTLSFSIIYIKKDPIIFYTSLFSFVLVVFQGWIGSIVVSTNLLPGMITLHMLLAVILVFSLTYAIAKSNAQMNSLASIPQRSFINGILFIAIFLTFSQLMIGTQVREAIDEIAKSLGGGERNNWINQIGLEFYIHRSFSWLVLLSQGYFLYIFSRQIKGQRTIMHKINIGLLGLVLLEVLAGVGLAYGGMPAFLQPIHLLLAVTILGLQFWLLLLINQDLVLVKKMVKPTAFVKQ